VWKEWGKKKGKGGGGGGGESKHTVSGQSKDKLTLASATTRTLPCSSLCCITPVPSLPLNSRDYPFPSFHSAPRSASERSATWDQNISSKGGGGRAGRAQPNACLLYQGLISFRSPLWEHSARVSSAHRNNVPSFPFKTTAGPHSLILIHNSRM